MNPRSITFLAALLLAPGCAFTPEVIRLEPDLSPVTAAPGAGSIALRLAVDDLRPEPSQVVARKINGFGMQLATISSEAPVAEALHRAVASGLAARGYRVDDAGPARLNVELLVFSHEFRVGFWSGRSEALVTLLATVRDAAGRELFRAVIAQPYSHSVQLASGENVKKAYEGALTAAVEGLVTSEAFERALALGSAPPVL